MLWVAQRALASLKGAWKGADAAVEILNNKPFVGVARRPNDVAMALQRKCLEMQGRFMDEHGRAINYTALRESDIFAEFLSMTPELQTVDLAALSPAELMAFFLSSLPRMPREGE